MNESDTTQEVTTQEGYARWASSYDQETNALIVLEEAYIDQLLAPLSYSNVLDVGTGTGRHALKLARTGHYGWRTGFRQADVRYLLPNMPHTRNDYLEPLAPNGLTLLKVLDLPLRALPPRRYGPPLTEEFIQLHGEMLFCLLILAQKV